MTKPEMVALLALIAKVYPTQATDKATLAAWYDVMGDTEPDAALAATRSLLRQPNDFPPKPGHILAEVARLNGSTAPLLEAATGYFMAGNINAHPAVARAAATVYWDRAHKPDEARWQFRDAYSAELDREQNGHVRTELGSGNGPQRLALVMPNPALKPAPTCETCNSVGMVETSAGAIPCEECS